MLRLQGSPKRLCDGLTRRDLLHVGGLGAFGLTLADLLTLSTARADQGTGFGKAKSCILLFPFGSPAQHETFDPKPDAPVEIQGEMKGIPTSLPGVLFGEGLPQSAEIADRITTIRSMTHPYPLHGVAYAMTGMPTYTPDVEARPRDPMHWPYIGSIVDYLARQSGEPDSILRHVGLPWPLNSKVEDYPLLAGPYSAFLGQAHDPLWADFEGTPTRIAPKIRIEQAKEFLDPYCGVKPDCRFTFHGAGKLPEGVSGGRMDLRRTLLEQLDVSRRRADAAATARTFTRQQETALSLITSAEVRKALDISREPMSLRERYGLTLFGQSCLAARRLIEAGSRFVTVFWDAFGLFGNGAWDTHANHYPRLKQELLPGFDPAYATLIKDLDERGLLDETLVLQFSEHGRTPQIDSKPHGAARHHWSSVYSATVAGGGVKRGAVVGSSDRHAGEVRDTPVTPKDLLATAFYLLGIDPHGTVPDQLGRPHPMAGNGQVRFELIA